jgi:hypothetical protein
LTANRFTSGDVAARRRAPASLINEAALFLNDVSVEEGMRSAYSTSLKRSVSIMRSFVWAKGMIIAESIREIADIRGFMSAGMEGLGFRRLWAGDVGKNTCMYGVPRVRLSLALRMG